MLASLFPPQAATAERLQPGELAQLHPQEAQQVRKAIAKRVGEFAAGRICARQALQRLGVEEFPLLMGADRRPQWPPGIVGSITHTHGYYAAAAARHEALRAIGVDAERVGRVGRHLWPKICTAAELTWLQGLPEPEQARAGALIFSAKEAFYKCQYELTQAWVGFHDVALEPIAGAVRSGHFAVRPMRSLELEQLLPSPWTGLWCLGGDLVVSGMTFAA